METVRIALSFMTSDSNPPSDDHRPENDPKSQNPDEEETVVEPIARHEFPPTSLTEVVNSLGDDEVSEKALASLCQKYWHPLYAFLRRRGHDPEDAKDLTQGFFASFLSGKAFADFDPKRGKLRTYMLHALKHYESSDRRKREAQKRGGGVEFVSFDWMEAERWLEAEPTNAGSPEEMYDLRWAIALLNTVQERLRERYVAKGKGKLFDSLQIFLGGKPEPGAQEKAAESLGMSHPALKMAISRMREQRRQIVRSEIGKTVVSPDQISGEIAYLISLFQKSGEGAIGT